MTDDDKTNYKNHCLKLQQQKLIIPEDDGSSKFAHYRATYKRSFLINDLGDE